MKVEAQQILEKNYACCLLRHSACNVLLHNPKADYLIKNQHGPVSLGKWWGLVTCEPGTLWQLSMITSWGGSISIFTSSGCFFSCGTQSNSLQLAGIHVNHSLCKIRCVSPSSA